MKARNNKGGRKKCLNQVMEVGPPVLDWEGHEGSMCGYAHNATINWVIACESAACPRSTYRRIARCKAL